MLLDSIATALRSFDFYMIVHGNAKMKSKKGIKNWGNNEQNAYRLRWRKNEHCIEEEEDEDGGIRVTPSKMMIRK